MVIEVSDEHLESPTPQEKFELPDPEDEGSTLLRKFGDYYQSTRSNLPKNSTLLHLSSTTENHSLGTTRF
jgi:hypothetical protein